ncbi:hypothetical protein BC828DRAFT_416883 [Blastocladiella britannica]|nr:hypothetical protein BC828DRAFT_416883 [Blastocladiella britannica]
MNSPEPRGPPPLIVPTFAGVDPNDMDGEDMPLIHVTPPTLVITNRGSGGAGAIRQLLGGRIMRCSDCNSEYSVLAQFKSDGAFADITLTLPSGRTMDAHKFVLATASLTLQQALLAKPHLSQLDLRQFLPSDPQHATELVLDYAYSRHAHVYPGNVLGVAHVARALGIADLHRFAITMLAQFVGTDPAAMVHAAVHFYVPYLQTQIATALASLATPRNITDTSTWDATARLPPAAFAIIFTTAGCPLSMDARFSLIQRYMQLNIDSPIPLRAVGPDGSAAPRMLLHHEITDLWSLVDFKLVSTEALAKGFELPHVPKHRMFSTLMTRLVATQAQAYAADREALRSRRDSASSTASGSQSSVPSSPTIPSIPSSPGLSAISPAAFEAMSDTQQIDYVSATLARISKADDRRKAGNSGHGPPPMPTMPPPTPPLVAAILHQPQPRSPQAALGQLGRTYTFPPDPVGTRPGSASSLASPPSARATPPPPPPPRSAAIRVSTMPQTALPVRAAFPQLTSSTSVPHTSPHSPAPGVFGRQAVPPINSGAEPAPMSHTTHTPAGRPMRSHGPPAPARIRPGTPTNSAVPAIPSPLAQQHHHPHHLGSVIAARAANDGISTERARPVISRMPAIVRPIGPPIRSQTADVVTGQQGGGAPRGADEAAGGLRRSISNPVPAVAMARW